VVGFILKFTPSYISTIIGILILDGCHINHL